VAKKALTRQIKKGLSKAFDGIMTTLNATKARSKLYNLID
jgi:hypothetical protein